ncbi:phosphatidate cytidylyltransferase [Candidatus Pelagibacter bacterium]|jgi:phosphatidate cytidylyltransferase|nr:phosphatidate cytidylyltransferase [Candidatus Pelagibacter bacterium]|tara:strand:- start:545 stop:1201 length:657 start_codon:yes stop_codon:yes gene_type:complete
MNLELKKRIVTSILLLFLLYLMINYSYILIISLIIISVVTWIEFNSLIYKVFKKKNLIIKFLFKLLSLIYLSSLVFLILYIETEQTHLKICLIYSILVSIVTDIGGLLIGRTIKGKKLTKISPKKTISGSIGSFLFSLVLVPIFYNELLEYNLLYLIIITLLISLTSQVGDILISYLKRRAKVKDTSDILPGHGGFLDRIDGIIFALPIGILLFSFNL